MAVAFTLSGVAWFRYDYDRGAWAFYIIIGIVLMGEFGATPVGRFGVGYDCLSKEIFGFVGLLTGLVFVLGAKFDSRVFKSLVGADEGKKFWGGEYWEEAGMDGDAVGEETDREILGLFEVIILVGWADW